MIIPFIENNRDSLTNSQFFFPTETLKLSFSFTLLEGFVKRWRCRHKQSSTDLPHNGLRLLSYCSVLLQVRPRLNLPQNFEKKKSEITTKSNFLMLGRFWGLLFMKNRAIEKCCRKQSFIIWSVKSFFRWEKLVTVKTLNSQQTPRNKIQSQCRRNSTVSFAWSTQHCFVILFLSTIGKVWSLLCLSVIRIAFS